MLPLLGLSTLLLGGCAMGGYVTVSRPNLSPDSREYAIEEKPGVFRTQSLGISVKPSNADVSILTAGIIVPVVPLGTGNKVRKGEPFRLVVQFEHGGDSYSYTPALTTLHTSMGDMAPIGVMGPLTKIESPEELEKTSFGLPWICSSQGVPMKTEVSAEINIPAKSCFVLEFALSTLPPQEQFSVELNGLKKDSATLSKIEVQFRPEKRVTGSWLGGE